MDSTFSKPTTQIGGHSLTLEYLRHLWPTVPDGCLLIWTLPEKTSHWFKPNEADRLASAAAKLAVTSNVYLGCGLAPCDFGPHKRCDAEDIIGIPGLWADVDFAGPAHKKEELPPDIEKAIALVMAMPLPPSLIVHSGHGIYPWWLFSSPWIFVDPQDRARAAGISRDWQACLKTLAENKKWTIDGTADLARVLRLPGTINRKADPIQVTVEIPETVRRYSWFEVENALAKVIKPVPKPMIVGQANHGNLDDDALIRKAMAAKNGEKFRDLWNGNLNGHPSQSEADADLCCRLVWWTQHDGVRVDRLFRRSGLMRLKWNERHSGDGKTYGQMTIASALAKVTTDYDPAYKGAPDNSVKPIDVQDVQLVIIDARKTKSKIVATVAIIRAGVPVDMLTVTTATSSRHGAAREIAKHVTNADPLKIDMALGQLMLLASEMASKVRVRDGETVREIVARVVTEDFRPAYRTPAGFFSESRGQEIRRQDLIGYTPSSLVDLAESAVDAPRRDDGQIIRTALLKSIKAELEIQFADMVRSLPLATEANLAEKSAAGREFAAAMVRMLTLPKTWEASKDGNARRASIVSRAASAITSHLTHNRKPTRSWIRVLDACNCWWRIGVLEDGEIVPLIAIRYELAHQIGVTLPGVSDEESLVVLGVKFGVIDSAPPVSARTNQNSVRLAVLKREFIEPLLTAAGDFLDADDGACGRPPAPNVDGDDG
jgi:hypothetical protein